MNRNLRDCILLLIALGLIYLAARLEEAEMTLGSLDIDPEEEITVETSDGLWLGAVPVDGKYYCTNGGTLVEKDKWLYVIDVELKDSLGQPMQCWVRSIAVHYEELTYAL